MSGMDVRSSEFWDLGRVEAELRRVADLCHGCRRCLPLCPSFRVLFERLDADAVDGDAERLPRRDLQEVVELCYQCKLCYNHCPYTPPHRWAVDFPRLMLRARAAEARAHGVRWEDRVLGHTELVGTLGSLTAPLSNWMSRWRLHRVLLERLVGIHRHRLLPRFHRQRFSRWFRRHAARRPAPAPPGPRVALFATCTVEYHEPAVGRAAVRVLEHNGVDVSLPPQRCCGMPYLDGGAVGEAQALIRDNVRTLAAAVREGRDIVVPGPTCSYMLKQEYPWLDGSEDARLVAAHTRDLFEYLATLAAAGRFNTAFVRPVASVAYHVPCHLRAQNIGLKTAEVLRRIPGITLTAVERCSAVDGTWGFKRRFHELSLRLAAPLFDALRTSGAAVWATDCPLAALQILQGTGTRARHPVQVLAFAYGFDDEEP
jgi:glycerol-3-phosphate dehydrogenase subunit C